MEEISILHYLKQKQREGEIELFQSYDISMQ